MVQNLNRRSAGSKMFWLLLFVAWLAAGTVLPSTAEISRLFKDEIKQFFLSHSPSPSFKVPVNVSVCIQFASPNKLDGRIVEETLASVRGSHRPMHLKEHELLEGIEYRFNYRVVVRSSCDRFDGWTLVVETTREVKTGFDEPPVTRRPTGVLRVSEALTGGELAGKVAGRIIGQISEVFVPDLSRKLLFPILEDSGVEISILGFHHQMDSVNPLMNLNHTLLKSEVRRWIGSNLNDTIIKATTRDLDDHPAVLSALMHARAVQPSMTYDPKTGRFISQAEEQNAFMDPAEFVRGVGESTDSLVRIGSAQRLARLRRREVEIYVILAESPMELFRDRSRLHAAEGSVVVLVPPEPVAGFDLTQLILRGLADTLAGIPFDSIASLVPSGSTAPHLKSFSLGELALRNMAIHEVSRSIFHFREAFKSVALPPDQMDRLIAHCAMVDSQVRTGAWENARSFVREHLKPLLAAVMRKAITEKRKCCETRVVGSDQGANIAAPSALAFLYLFVGACIVGVVVALAWLSQGDKRRGVKIVFGREHVD